MSTSDSAYATIGSTWRHRNAGDVTVVAHGHIEATREPCVVYQCRGMEDVEVRPSRDFFDGRFTPVCAETTEQVTDLDALRAWAFAGPSRGRDLCITAADEIERLRAALRINCLRLVAPTPTRTL